MPEREGSGSDRHGSFRVGTSGYEYNHWRGLLYPEDLPKRKWLSRFVEEFDTVEINNSFYHLPLATSFERWRDTAPPGFVFALKFSRYGTHLKHLREPHSSLDPFLERATLLRGKLGPILVQLPPSWQIDAERLDAFLAAAPRAIRWTVEFRHRSWLVDEVYAILERHGAALCIHDRLADHPWRLTADWMYMRYHGGNYDGRYSAQRLSADAERLARELRAGRDVYVYFNNDLGGHAVVNARQMREYLGKRVGRAG
jgi:uncharacterized protein YecE (DUF72 family)